MNRVFIDRFDPPDLRAALGRALDWIGAPRLIGPATRVFIKPNLTWKTPTPGVTVTPAFLRALVEELLPLTRNITIGEAEGGQACFQAEDAFESHGLYELEREHGVRVVNLSTQPAERVATSIGGRTVALELPTLLLRETDVFITVPVPKVHAMTGVSLGFKNQWGCLGDKMRVTQHPHFDHAVLAINRLVNTRLCVFDGTYFLDYTGPMMGRAVPMNMVIAGDQPGAPSRVCCAIMQIRPESSSHQRLAIREGMMPSSLGDIELNQPLAPFQGRRFKLRRAPINYVHLAAFKNRALNSLFYDSAAADALHEMLWMIRRNALIRRMLYGKFGPGEANRGGRDV